MKGMAEDIWWTIIVYVVVFVAFIVLFVFFIAIKTADLVGKGEGGPLEYSLRFVDAQNRPYFVGHVLTNVRVEDRNLLEHIIEASATGSLNNSQSENLPLVLKNIMDSYKFKYYLIVLRNITGEVFSIDSTQYRCGQNQEGLCGDAYCDIGWVRIDEGANECRNSGNWCCKFDPQEFESQENLHIVSCGLNDAGICGGGSDVPFCFSLSTKIDDISDTCKNVNKVNGKSQTPVCCEPAEPVVITSNTKAKATIPIIYKDNFSVLEVVVGE